METSKDILHLLQKHINKYPNEVERLQQYQQFVAAQQGNQLFDRKNFAGHITASAFIIDEQGEQLLLLRHKFLNRWLQPGGHVDAYDDTIAAAALREAEEETGIRAAQLTNLGLIEFDSHQIPANVKKNEEPHYHHDARFLFRYTGNSNIVFSAEESTSSRWVQLGELRNDDEFGRVVEKIQQMLKEVSAAV